MAQSLYRVVVRDPQTDAVSYKRNSARWNAINETARDSVKQLGLIVEDIQTLNEAGEYISDTKAMEEFRKLFNGKVSAGNPVLADAFGQYAEFCKAVQKDLKKGDMAEEDIAEFVNTFVSLCRALGIDRKAISEAMRA